MADRANTETVRKNKDVASKYLTYTVKYLAPLVLNIDPPKSCYGVPRMLLAAKVPLILRFQVGGPKIKQPTGKCSQIV